jgi:AmmeMemoRadiSam system protein B
VKNKEKIILILLSISGFLIGYFAGEINTKTDIQKKNEITDTHYSYFSDKQFLDRSYDGISKIPVSLNNIKGVIVNHHLLASDLIAKTINTISTATPITVVLISPNHFSVGKGQIISSLYNWSTPYGILDCDKNSILKLKESGSLNIDEYPFAKEHGISGVVPFIKKSLPNARVIPVIVKDSISEKDIKKFVEDLYSTLGNDVIVVGSFDFSHFFPNDITQIYDIESISAIKKFDFIAIKKIQVDSVPGLEIVMNYMKKVGATHFDLIANTNSSKILNDSTIKEVVSYVDGSFSVEY